MNRPDAKTVLMLHFPPMLLWKMSGFLQRAG